MIGAALIPAISSTLGMAPDLIQLLDKKGQANQIQLAQEQARVAEANARAAEAAKKDTNYVPFIIVGIVVVGIIIFISKKL